MKTKDRDETVCSASFRQPGFKVVADAPTGQRTMDRVNLNARASAFG